MIDASNPNPDPNPSPKPNPNPTQLVTMIDASNASKSGVAQRLSEEEASAAWSNRVAAETHTVAA